MASTTNTLPSANQSKQGYTLVLTATVIWASTGVFMSYLFLHYTLAPLTLAFWRDMFTATVLILILLAVKPVLLRVNRRDLPFLLAYGLFGLACFNAIWTYSVAYNGASVSTVLIYTGPAFVALASRWLFGEPLYWNKILAIILAFSGCVLVAQVYDLGFVLSNPTGTVIGLLAGVGFAVYSLFGKAASKRLNPWTTTAYIFAFGSFFLLLTRPYDQLWSMGPTVDGWLILLALAAPTLGGYGLYMVSLGHLPVSVASIVVALEPAFTALMAFAILGERLTAIQIVGSMLIFAGVVVLRLKQE